MEHSLNNQKTLLQKYFNGNIYYLTYLHFQFHIWLYLPCLCNFLSHQALKNTGTWFCSV